MSRLFVKNLRVAFPKFAEPERFPTGDDPTRYFSGTFILGPDHPQLGEIKKIIHKCISEKWPGQDPAAIWNAADRMGKITLHEGSVHKPDLEGFAGNWYVSSRTSEKKGRPKVYGLGGVPAGELKIGQPGYPYAGCFVNAVLTFFAYGGVPGIPKGVGSGLGDVQFLRDGDAFSGAKAATADEMGDISVPMEAQAQPEAQAATAVKGSNPWD